METGLNNIAHDAKYTRYGLHVIAHRAPVLRGTASSMLDSGGRYSCVRPTSDNENFLIHFMVLSQVCPVEGGAYHPLEEQCTNPTAQYQYHR